jgi:hypothetical protein
MVVKVRVLLGDEAIEERVDALDDEQALTAPFTSPRQTDRQFGVILKDLERFAVTNIHDTAERRHVPEALLLQLSRHSDSLQLIGSSAEDSFLIFCFYAHCQRRNVDGERKRVY